MSTDPLDNDGRADFAATALTAYYDETRNTGDTYGDEGSDEFNDAFSDLLGDLQHLALRSGVVFHDLLATGTSHFEEEIQEQMALARQEEERIRQENAPLDEKVYAAVNGDFHHFAKFRETCGIPVPELRRSLLRLLEQGKIEQVYGKGWRRVSAAEQATAEAIAYEEAFNG